MACLAMHLAVGYRYIQKNKNEDEKLFIEGSVSPDLADDKVLSHFGVNIRPTTVREMLEYKMDIVKIAKSYSLDDSKSKAEFLHLVCDDIFYRFVYSEELEKWSPQEVKQAMFDDYDFVTSYILKKYNFELPDNLKHLANEKEGESKFFTPESIDTFIEILSDLDLSNTQKEILTNLEGFRNEIMSKLEKRKSR